MGSIERLVTASYYDKLEKFVNYYADEIDARDVEKVFMHSIDTNLFTEFEKYITFSIISNQWLDEGFDPLTKLKSVPYMYGICITQDKLVIPSNCTDIDERAFVWSNIKEIELPEGVKSISQFAFDGCTELQKINFPSTLKTVKEGAFKNCVNLRRVDVADPDQLFRISYNAFGKSGTTPFNDSRGGAFYFNGSEIKSLSTPTDINSIKSNAFKNVLGLETLNVTYNVKRISYFAFSGCKDLSKVTMEEGVEIIGGHAFSGCSNLKQVKLPKSVNDLRDGAFNRNTNVIRQ